MSKFTGIFIQKQIEKRLPFSTVVKTNHNLKVIYTAHDHTVTNPTTTLTFLQKKKQSHNYCYCSFHFSRA